MSEEISNIGNQQTNINLVDEVRELKEIIMEKGKKTEVLEHRIDDMEQRSVARDVITGLDIKHRSYASANTG